MNIARTALLVVTIVVLTAIAVTLLLPSVTTLDLSATTDRAQLKLNSDLAFDEETITVSEALVCGEAFSSNDRLTTGTNNLCEAARRTQLFATFAGHIDIKGPNQLIVQRLREKELEISIASTAADGLVTFHDQGGTTQTTRGAFIRVQRKFFEEGNVFTFVARVDKAVIGGTGGTSGNTRGVLLTSGTVVPLATSLFSSDVIRGKPVSLSMGDIVEFDREQRAPASILLRAESTHGISVAARLPIVELRIRNFASQGVPVSMSWWDRLAAEPALILLWALVGLMVTLLDWKERFLPSRESARPEIET